MAGAGFASGIIAQRFGFTPIFIMCGILSLSGTMILLLMKNRIDVGIHPQHGFEVKERK